MRRGTVAPCPVERFGRPVHGSLPTILRAYKASVTRRITEAFGAPDTPTWQRNYYEHVILDRRDLDRMREYIGGKPARRHEDGSHPEYPDVGGRLLRAALQTERYI